MSTETSRDLQADRLNYMEGNRCTDDISEDVHPAAVSETSSCCTTLSMQLGRAYNVHGNV